MQTQIFNHQLPRQKDKAACCHAGPQADTTGLPLLAIVGSPNVGKSVLFNALTGAYVTVSNYPGTTVELARGKGRLGNLEVGVLDTPGMYRLLPLTEEERVARDILLKERPDLVIHVVDAKNLERMLPMTLQLIEAGLPLILNVNLMDEAERLGVQVDVAALEEALGVPVVATALARGRGTEQLKERIATNLTSRRPQSTAPSRTPLQYHPSIEDALARMGAELNGNGLGITNRATALLLLQNDPELIASMRERAGQQTADELVRLTAAAQAQFSQPLSYLIANHDRETAQRILQPVLTLPQRPVSSIADRLNQAMINPLTGVPILLVVLLDRKSVV